MYHTKAYSAASATSPLAHTQIKRRDASERDVQIEILFCGICHSDLHSVRDEWSSIMPTVYPIVPGHEIVGRVTKVGPAVTKYKPGDLAAVGCLVDSDGTCPHCKAGFEQFCPNVTLTFNSPDKHLGGVTYGGYSESIVVDERFVLRVPANLNLAGTAPLLAPGSRPTRRCAIGASARARRWASSVSADWATWASSSPMRSEPTSSSSPPRPTRRRTRSASAPTKWSSPATPARCRSTPAASTSFSTRSPPITTSTRISTCCAAMATSPWSALPQKPLGVSAFGLIMGRRSLSGSAIGGIAETQEMLDFCGAHNITADVEVIPIQKVNEAYERLLKSDVKYRFSIDMASLKSE